MPPIPRRRATAPPPARPPGRPPRLTREGIVAAALDLMDQIGLDELTMRRLATELDVQAAALYRHVRDKDELLDLMADTICAEAPLPDPGLPWLVQLEQTAHIQRALLRGRRDAARLIAGTAPTGLERLRLIDATLRALLSAGFSGEEAFQVALLLTNFVTGMVMEEVSNPAAQAAAAGIPDEQFAESSRQWLDALPADVYPHIHRAAADMPQAAPFDADAHFAFGLDVLLTGLHARVAGKARA